MTRGTGKWEERVKDEWMRQEECKRKQSDLSKNNLAKVLDEKKINLYNASQRYLQYLDREKNICERG